MITAALTNNSTPCSPSAAGRSKTAMSSKNNTSVFTLPQERRRRHPKGEGASIGVGAVGGDRPNDCSSYEEFPSAHPQSPSLPWFVEYWSSSLLRTPSMLTDLLCSGAACGAGAAYYPNSPINTTALDESYRIDDIDTYDFGGTLNRGSSNAKGPHSRHHPLRSPVRGSKWEALRSVVASHDDDASDYEDCYGADNEGDDNTSVVVSCGVKKKILETNVPHPEHGRRPKNYYRQSSIVVDEEEDDEDYNDADTMDEDDDVRMEPEPESLVSSRAAQESGDASISRDSIAGLTLNTCHSFDQYVDTTRYLTAAACASPTPATPTATKSPTARTPASTGHDSGPRRRVGGRHRHRNRPRTPRKNSPRRSGRTPPSPAQSTSTYTTISLSQSFLNEFENEENSVSASAITASSSSSFEEDLNNGYLFLDRLASEQLLISSSSSNSLNAGKRRGSRRRGNPFRLRQRPSTTDVVTSIIDEYGNAENTGNSRHEDEKKEEDREERLRGENQEPISHQVIKPAKKLSSDDEDEGDNNDSRQYRYLIRMSPRNYRHRSSSSAAAAAALSEGAAGDAMRGEEDFQPYDVEVHAEDVSSNTSSSVLLPLHPHQRILSSDGYIHFE